MKELSIEEKAKCYDEAIERAQSLKNKWIDEDGEDVAFMIFPELKESEDERVRKTLKEYFINSFQNNGVAAICGMHIKDILAWLEKQGEKPQGKSALEAIKEEKVDDANKVEPKFKNGQWIVWQDKCYKVNDNGCGYELIDQNGLSMSLEYETIDESAHLWNVTKDAKDGDVLVAVLVDEDKIFIYNGKFDLRGRVCAYCGIYKTHDGLRFTECAIGNYFTYKEPHPATKEQRDTLMKAMADAGYTFNFEKKELKKLGQSEVTKTSDQEEIAEIPFGAKDSELQEAIYFIPKGFHAEIDDDKVVIKKDEKPTAWSEEDEQITLSIEQVMNCASLLNIVPEKTDKIRTWLKSLKQRIGG